MAVAGSDANGGSPLVNRKLEKAQRLKSRERFQEAYREGNNRVGRLMVVWVRHGDDAALRLGVVSSRKIGNAVKRNLARRRIREAYRRCRPYLNGDCDLVIVCRFRLIYATWSDVVGELLRLCHKLKLITLADLRIARRKILNK